MKIELMLPIPPSTNHLYKTIMMPAKTTGQLVPRRAKTDDAKLYVEWVRLGIIAKYGVITMRAPVKIVGVLYGPDWRIVDLDNKKILYDSLGKWLGFDDRYLIEEHWRKVVAKWERPRIEFSVEEVRP